MKILSKVSKVLLTIAFVLGLVGPVAALAATTPSLGTSATFGILSSTFTNSNTPPYTNVTGDIGYTVAGAPVTAVLTHTGTVYPENAGYTAAGSAQGTALTNLNGQVCTTITGPLNATVVGVNPAGTFPPGCYTMAGALIITLGTSITLDLTATGGVGSTWIFKSTGGGLTTGADSFVTLANGASACNVFWVPVGAANIGAYTGALPNTTKLFIGTIIDNAGIGLGQFANLLGRALAFNGTVTTNANTITVPTCAAVTTGSHALARNTPLIGLLKVPTPLALVSPGSVTYNYTAWNIAKVQAITDVTVIDDKCSPVKYLSGDFNNNNKIDSAELWKYSCTSNLAGTTTNTAIATGYSDDVYHQATIATAIATVNVGSPLPAPIINLVKVPSQLSLLPFGGKDITFTYTVTNPGVVAIHDVLVTDDKCAPVSALISGDTNGNGLLDINESWKYTCKSFISVSTGNVGTAKGNANGITALAYAFVNVLVGVPELPNTGFFTDMMGGTWNTIILLGIFALLLVLVLKRRRA